MFNPRNHFWVRNNKTVYSSAAQADLPADHAAYRAFLADDGITTPYPKDEQGVESPAELAAVLSVYGVEPYGPLNPAVLSDAPAPTARAAIAVSATATAMPMPVEPPIAAAAHSEQRTEAKACAADTPAPPAPAHPATGRASGNADAESANAEFMTDEKPRAGVPCKEPRVEVDSHGTDAAVRNAQQMQAEANGTGSTALTPAQSYLAAARCIEKDALAKRIQVKAALYQQVASLLLEQQQAVISDAGLSDAEQITALEQLDAAVTLPRQLTDI